MNKLSVVLKKYSHISVEITGFLCYFISAGNEPSGHAGMSIWRLPRGAKTPQLGCAANLMPRNLLRGF